MTVLEVQHLGKKYVIDHRNDPSKYSLRELISSKIFRSDTNILREEFWALKDINFKLEDGEVLGIIGPNGSGKSTLLKLISRITKATTGKIRIRGKVASLLELGTGFHPELTGRENIFLNGVVMGMKRSEIRDHFDEIVAFAGVEKFLDTPIKRYSSGMQVRLGFSVSTHLSSDILLVDEVLAVGDLEFQKKCIQKMEELARIGKSIIIVSHNMDLLRKVAVNCLIIDQSLLKYSGPVDKCIAHYRG